MEVKITGVRYLPVAKSNPSAEQIARAIMKWFWGELPEDLDWETEAKELRVSCSDSEDGNCPTVMEVVAEILARIKQ